MNFQLVLQWELVFTLINMFFLNSIRSFCVKNLNYLTIGPRKYSKDQWCSLILGMKATENGNRMSNYESKELGSSMRSPYFPFLMFCYVKNFLFTLRKE